MSRADYWICPVCDGKALYDDGEGYEDGPDVVVLHRGCYERLASSCRDAVAEVGP